MYVLMGLCVLWSVGRPSGSDWWEQCMDTKQLTTVKIRYLNQLLHWFSFLLVWAWLISMSHICTWVSIDNQVQIWLMLLKIFFQFSFKLIKPDWHPLCCRWCGAHLNSLIETFLKLSSIFVQPHCNSWIPERPVLSTFPLPSIWE